MPTVLAAVSNLDKFKIPADDLIGDGIVFCSQFHDFSLFCDETTAPSGYLNSGKISVEFDITEPDLSAVSVRTT